MSKDDCPICLDIMESPQAVLAKTCEECKHLYIEFAADCACGDHGDQGEEEDS